MKKILLTAIVAMFGMSAFAENTSDKVTKVEKDLLPADGTIGYLFSPAVGMVITADATLSNTEGMAIKLTNEYKKSNKECYENGWKTATSNVNYDYDAEDAAGKFYTCARFLNNAVADHYLKVASEGKLSTADKYWNKWAVEVTEKGWLIRYLYDPTDQSGVGTIAQGDYLTANADGTLSMNAEVTDGAYWQFIDEPTYKKIVGPTYPIDLSGDAAKVAVEVNGEEATFTPTGTVQNQFQIKNMDISEFRAYGYKKIVVEFSGAAAGQFHAHAYENGNDPHWDIVTGVTGFNNDYEAPAWLSIGENKFEVELRADKDAIEDFTIFTWFDESAGAITVKAYFSKDELATSISSVKVAKAAKGIYNVAGQQMKNLQKGLNIVDGKKIWIK